VAERPQHRLCVSQSAFTVLTLIASLKPTTSCPLFHTCIANPTQADALAAVAPEFNHDWCHGDVFRLTYGPWKPGNAASAPLPLLPRQSPSTVRSHTLHSQQVSPATTIRLQALTPPDEPPLHFAPNILCAFAGSNSSSSSMSDGVHPYLAQDGGSESKLGVAVQFLGWLANGVGRMLRHGASRSSDLCLFIDPLAEHLPNFVSSCAPMDIFILLSWSCRLYTVCVSCARCKISLYAMLESPCSAIGNSTQPFVVCAPSHTIVHFSQR
jgi:hypothetical protein